MALVTPYGRCAATFMGMVILASSLNADTINPQGFTSAPPPLLSTNAASSTFLQSHPELAQPSSPMRLDQPGIPFHQPEAATNETTEASPPPLEINAESTHFPGATNQSGDLADHLLVVYNQNDPDSQGLADYYASRRNIPPERVLAIACPTVEEITRAQYDETIRQPITSYICQKNWMERHSRQARVITTTLDILVATRNDIWAIVLMRGVPLKIAPDPTDLSGMEQQAELLTNAAAVDSELALLPMFGLPKGGYVPNPFFDAKLTGAARVGPELAKSMILVTRLDGPQPGDVRRMIDDSLYAEKNRLAGLAVIDARGLTNMADAYTPGDVWLRSARDMLLQDGWTVRFDDTNDVLPATEPCNHVALYMGWYTDTAKGPWVTPPDRFVRGAIAYHLHSFSASTVRSDKWAWVGPLISHGAAASMGTVYEPYLTMTPHEDIFTKRLLDGNYFAEAAYASQKGLSWMTTVVGDPLYRPFLQPLDTTLAGVGIHHTEHDDWLFLQSFQRDLMANRIEMKTQSIMRVLDVPGSGPVAYEGLGDLLAKLNDPLAGPSVEMAYEKASQQEVMPVDRIRVGIKLAQFYATHGQSTRALTEMESMRQLYPVDAKQFGVPDPMVPTSIPSGNPASVKAPANDASSSQAMPALPKPPQPPRPH